MHHPTLMSVSCCDYFLSVSILKLPVCTLITCIGNVKHCGCCLLPGTL